MKNIAAISLLMLASALPSTVIAGALHNLRTVPESPAAGQPFLAVFENGPCEDFLLEPPALPPTVVREGPVLSVAIDYLGVFDCAAPIVTRSVPVGGLAQGEYSLQLIARAFQSPENSGPLQTIALTVGPALPRAPSPIPASGGIGLGVLGVIIGGAGLWMMRRRIHARLGHAWGRDIDRR